MTFRLIFLILLIFQFQYISSSSSASEFTCQGPTYNSAANNCPDRGVQRLSAGGNVTIFVRNGINLPNKDWTGPSALVSDPYVKFRAGKTTARTRSIRNDLSPNWFEPVSLGLLGSASLIEIEIWDADSGLELSDDLMLKSTIRVPFCTTFTANYSQVSCGKPFGCESSDSSWPMPKRQLCNETGYISFGGGDCTRFKGTCLYFEIHIVPFTMEVALENTRTMLQTPALTAAASPSDGSWTKDFGLPFLGDDENYLDLRIPQSRGVKGGLMLRANRKEKNAGNPGDWKFYAAVNLPSIVYVCRLVTDNELGVPDWLLSPPWHRDNVSTTQVILTGGSDAYGCFYQQLPEGTVKNKWGGVVSGAVELRSTKLPSHPENLYYYDTYIVLAVPYLQVIETNIVTIIYDVAVVLSFVGSNGLVFAWFMFLIANFLRKIDFRIDRVDQFLSSRVMTGEDKTVLASLFLTYGETPCNIEYRSRLYHASNAIYLFLALPILILFTWGFSCSFAARPAAVGTGVAFLGTAGVLLWFGFRLWEVSSWRMTGISLAAIAGSVIFFLIYIASVVFEDPAVILYGEKLNFAALSLVFGTFNCFPLMLLSFKQDKSYQTNMKRVLIKLSETLAFVKGGGKSSSHSYHNSNNSNAPHGKSSFQAKDLQINKILHALLGNCYTINPNVPLFKFSSVLQELDLAPPPAKKAPAPDSVPAQTGPPPAPSLSSVPPTTTEAEEEELQTTALLYRVSLFPLAVYMLIALVRTGYPSLAFVHIISLMILDGIHTSITHGDTKWTPGFKISLLVLGRVLVMGSSPVYWIVSYSGMYLLYSSALIREMINKFLPNLSKRQACEAVFAVDATSEPVQDLAGDAAFSLGWLTFYFVTITIVSALGKTQSVLPIEPVPIWGASWPVYTFSILALLLVINGALITATFRSFYLKSHGLLRGWARTSYMLRETIDVPMTFAILTEISLLTSGLFVYGITHSNVVLIFAVYMPIIVLCFAHAYKTWVSNDYDLVVWPPREKPIAQGGETPTDLEVAFNMIEKLFGEGSQDTSELYPETEDDEDNDSVAPIRTLKGFKLPALQAPGSVSTGGTVTKLDEAIKMPALPLKSVLRKKRQQLGIKVKPPLVKDLRVREGGEMDKFGSDEVLDINDPWTQFEDAGVVKKIKKKKAATNFVYVERAGFMQQPWIQSLRKGLSENFLFQEGYKLCRDMSDAVLKCLSLSRAYAKVADDPDASQHNLDGSGSGTGTGGGSGNRAQRKKDLWTAEPTGPSPSSDASGPDGVIVIQGEVIDPETGDRVSLLPADGEAVQDIPLAERLAKLSYSDAVYGGYLSSEEYTALGSWYGGLFFVMLMGITIARTNSPGWLGHVLWVSVWMFLFTMIPVIKYFNTFTFDDTMKGMARFVTLFHFIFCLSFFLRAFHGDIGITPSLWILDYFLYFPAFLYLCLEFLNWRNNNYKIEALDKDGDNDVTLMEYISYFRVYPLLVVMMILLDWQMYFWVNPLTGQIGTIMILLSVIGYVFVRDWAISDFFLSPELMLVGNWLVNITLFFTLIIGVTSSSNPAFSLSLFFALYIFRCAVSVLTRIIIADADTVIFFSPTVLPVYSYDPTTSDVCDETPLVKKILYMLLAGALWGAMLSAFLYPVNVGITIACMFLLGIGAAIASAMSYFPLKLSRYASMLTPEAIVGAASSATEKFADRRLPLDLSVPGWVEAADKASMDALKATLKDGTKSTVDRLKEKTALELAAEQISDMRGLTYIRDDSSYIQAQTADLPDVDEVDDTWYVALWKGLKEQAIQLFEMIPLTKMEGWVRHSESAFTFSDSIAEAIISGKGPFGFMGLEGSWFDLFQYAQNHPNMKFLQQPWLNRYDQNGNDKTRVQLSDHMDSMVTLQNIAHVEEALSYTYQEETRSCVHFLLMLVVAGESKMQREQILFQKFLRENRFRLASNGISPPVEIFSSASFSSINIPLVAVWLSTLSSEELERFQQLRQSFSEDQVARDEKIDSDDYDLLANANRLRMDRQKREMDMIERLKREVKKRQYERVQQFSSTLNAVERQKFTLRQEYWMVDPDCYVDSKEQELYDKFKSFYFIDKDEYEEWACHALGEIEAGQKDCKLGEYGRSYQYVDSEFPPNDVSVGECVAHASVLGWRCSPGISEGVQLFSDGSHPDDVVQGLFTNSWLISALNMLTASGGVKDGIVDEKVMSLFVGHYGPDGEMTHTTDVGGFCVRLFKQGVWYPVIMDDLLPMQLRENWTNDNKGMACSHVNQCKGLWVQLIEKAFAKFYGSYASLSKGYVHHALEDMTGCDAECITLAQAGRGIGKKSLWHSLLKYHHNGYILGAGTGTAAQVDKEIQDMGIVFESAYTVYDVLSIDGFKLVKLRNPPGDHDEWKGDWSDKSDLWTKRLKWKCGYVDADDNTFFISFDDFCNVFRYLYVCKWYDPKRWTIVQYPGFWKVGDEVGKNNDNLLNQFMDEQKKQEEAEAAAAGEGGAKPKGETFEEDPERMKRKMMRAKIDTAGGTPTVHNPGCLFHNNPHYALKIHRPTDLRVTVTQTDAAGRSLDLPDPAPFSILIVLNSHPTVPKRCKALTKVNLIASSGPARPAKVIHLHASLDPGMYNIIIPTYISGSVGHFVVTLTSNYRNDFRPLWPPKWVLQIDRNKAGQMIEPESLNNKISDGLAVLFGKKEEDEKFKEHLD